MHRLTLLLLLTLVQVLIAEDEVEHKIVAAKGEVSDAEVGHEEQEKIKEEIVAQKREKATGDHIEVEEKIKEEIAAPKSLKKHVEVADKNLPEHHEEDEKIREEVTAPKSRKKPVHENDLEKDERDEKIVTQSHDKNVNVATERKPVAVEHHEEKDKIQEKLADEKVGEKLLTVEHLKEEKIKEEIVEQRHEKATGDHIEVEEKIKEEIAAPKSLKKHVEVVDKNLPEHHEEDEKIREEVTAPKSRKKPTHENDLEGVERDEKIVTQSHDKNVDMVTERKPVAVEHEEAEKIKEDLTGRRDAVAESKFLAVEHHDEDVTRGHEEHAKVAMERKPEEEPVHANHVGEELDIPKITARREDFVKPLPEKKDDPTVGAATTEGIKQSEGNATTVAPTPPVAVDKGLLDEKPSRVLTPPPPKVMLKNKEQIDDDVAGEEGIHKEVHGSEVHEEKEPEKKLHSEKKILHEKEEIHEDKEVAMPKVVKKEIHEEKETRKKEEEKEVLEKEIHEEKEEEKEQTNEENEETHKEVVKPKRVKKEIHIVDEDTPSPTSEVVKHGNNYKLTVNANFDDPLPSQRGTDILFTVVGICVLIYGTGYGLSQAGFRFDSVARCNTPPSQPLSNPLVAWYTLCILAWLTFRLAEALISVGLMGCSACSAAVSMVRKGELTEDQPVELISVTTSVAEHHPQHQEAQVERHTSAVRSTSSRRKTGMSLAPGGGGSSAPPKRVKKPTRSTSSNPTGQQFSAGHHTHSASSQPAGWGEEDDWGIEAGGHGGKSGFEDDDW